MTQFEEFYILLGLFTLFLQAISVLHPIIKDVTGRASSRRQESKEVIDEKD